MLGRLRSLPLFFNFFYKAVLENLKEEISSLEKILNQAPRTVN